MSRPLGKIQRQVLKSLTQHNNGTWHSGCGWYWDTWSGTKRLMQSLERRGLVDFKPGNRHGQGYHHERWTINDKGKKELAK